MTLTTTQKNYIASHFGRGNCYVSSGISYTDPTGTQQTGSTMDVVSTLEEDPFGTGPARGPGGEMYKNIPSYQSITSSDIMGIGGSSYCVSSSTPTPTPTGGCSLGTRRCDGDTVEACMSVPGADNRWVDIGNCAHGCSNGACLPESSTTPSGVCSLGDRRCNGRVVEECVRVTGGGTQWDYLHTCEFGCTGAGVCTAEQTTSGDPPGSRDSTGPLEVTVGGETGTSCESGDPSVSLDTSSARAYYKSEPTPYVGVMGIKVTNHNDDDCYAYFAWEMRMWHGHGYVSCPASNPEVTEISRFLAVASDTRDITLKKVLANRTEEIGGSFGIPASSEGKKTVCLTLWGNYSYPALVDELAAAGYEQSIPW